MKSEGHEQGLVPFTLGGSSLLFTEGVACVAGAERLIRVTCPCIDPPRAVAHDTVALDRFVRSRM